MAGRGEVRIVLLGKTGLGKSSTGNTILNQTLFEVEESPSSVTRRTMRGETSIQGRNITVIDTPGYFDTGVTEEENRRAIVTCITECAPGPHAFLIILSVQTRYTDEERQVIQNIRQMFGEQVLRYAVVLFTHADQLRNGRTIEGFVRQSELLTNLVRQCGGGYHAFNNTAVEDRAQVQGLLRKIDAMVENNGGECYTNEMLRAIPPLASEEDRRSFIDALLVALIGMATGAILGAFYGVKIGVKGAVLLSGVLVVGACRKLCETEDIVKLITNVAPASIIPEAVSVTPKLKAVAMGLGLLVAAGGVLGGYEGLLAASEARSGGEAFQKAQKAVHQMARSYDTMVDKLAFGEDQG